MWLSARTVRREFPDLGPLSAADLERLVRQARRGLPRWRRATLVARIVGGDGPLYIGAFLVFALILAVERPGGDAAAIARGLAVLVALGAIPVLLGVSAGRALDRRALRDRMQRPSCTECRYSLESLPAPGGRTRCPECGEDQWVRPTDRTETAAEWADGELRLCTRCGYSLAGLPATENRLSCPECGVDQCLTTHPAMTGGTA